LGEIVDELIEIDLESVVAALRRDHSKLSARLRQHQHTITCEIDGVTLRLHFPAFRQGKATIHELVEVISLSITPFALSRAEIAQVDEKYQKISAEEFREETTKLNETAIKLFIKAAEATGRNGECGELLLYLLTEWVLEAPQIIAKMALKTNPNAPVLGADGVHARYCSATKRLYLYWGEAKLHADVGKAISSAAESIAKSLTDESKDHEISLVRRNIDFSGLDSVSKAELLNFLDPMKETSNKRYDVVTCLIGFNFDGYSKVGPGDGESAEDKFAALAEERLKAIAPTITTRLKEHGLDTSVIELFLLPVPSVQDLRDTFQAKIGWKKSA